MELKYLLPARAVETWLKRIEELEAELAETRNVKKVSLPRVVADEIQKRRNDGQTNFSIIKTVYTSPNYGEGLTPMIKWADQYQNPFLRALADGYNIDHTLEELFDETIRQGVKEIFLRRSEPGRIYDPSEEEAELAREITEFVKKAYTEQKQSG